MKKYFEIYLDDYKIDFCFKYTFENQKSIKLKLNALSFLQI